MKKQICNTTRKMMTLIKKVFLTLLIGLTFMSCEDFLDVELEEAQLMNEEVFNSVETAEAALAGIYSKLRSETLLSGNNSGLHILFGLYSDELDFYGQPGLGLDTFYNHTIVPSQENISALWNNTYNIVYTANSIMEGVLNSQSLTTEQKNKLIGQAHFIRGLTHFYLTEVFGKIPYIKTADHIQNATVHRLPINEVYDEIILDLLKAVELLPGDYGSGERVIPNKWVAKALLARVYLYSQDWVNAEIQSSDLINQETLFAWETDLNNVFLKESTTAIWQFKPSVEGNNTNEGSAFILTFGPPLNVALNPMLVEDMEENDLRKSQWIGEVTDGENSWYYPFKYKQRENTGASLEYSVIFRLAEQYLIRAEARTQMASFTAAQDDINKIRLRAGLEETTANTKGELLDAIVRERRFELFTEYGHRWFDIKRNNMASQILGPIKPGWKPTNILLPIPESELLLNPNLLPQNPGY